MSEKQISPVETEYASIDQQYERKVWWTKVAPVLKNVGLFVWSVIDVVLVFGTLIFFVWYLVQGVFAERALVARLQQNHSVQRSVSTENQAVGLVVSNAQVLPGTDGRYDLYGFVSNPNEQWIGRFDYYFETSAGDTEKHEGYVLPGRDQHLVELSLGGEEGDGRPGRAELIVENIQWERVKGVPGGDIADWLNVREQLLVSNLAHGAVTTIGSRDVVQTSFTILNDTAYSYWDIDLIILLRVGRNVVGVNKVRLPYLDAAETLNQTVSWFWSPSAGATPEIIPQIDFFDSEIYKENPGRPTGELLERL